MFLWVVLTAVAAWLAAWLVAFSKLRDRARERIQLDSRTREWSLHAAARLGENRVSPAELASYSALTAAEYIAAWAAIDPQVIAAADFSSAAEINNGLDFAHYIHHHYDSLSSAAKQGFLNRLTGYVGEQQAAEVLAHQGHLVQAAAESNQPVWDLVVDGHPANIKTVADIVSINGEAASHPDVIFVVPEDAHGEVGDNIVDLHGFGHDTAKEVTSEAVASVKGETAAHSLGLHLPWITIAFAAYRNYRLVKHYNQDLGTALKHAAIESVGRGAGVVIGAKVGGVIGGLSGPLGAVVGAVLGGIGGALLGGGLAEDWKMIPLRNALERFDHCLICFGRGFQHRLSQIRERALIPYRVREAAVSALSAHAAKRYRRPGFWLWPDFCTVLLIEGAAAARSQLAQEWARVLPALNIIDQAPQDGYRRLGALMINVPWLRQGIPYNEADLQAVLVARAEVIRERRKLNPAWSPP